MEQDTDVMDYLYNSSDSRTDKCVGLLVFIFLRTIFFIIDMYEVILGRIFATKNKIEVQSPPSKKI